MKRNIEELVTAGKSIADQHNALDIHYSEVEQLIKPFIDNKTMINEAFKAITQAYYMGIATASRTAK